jgi:hypothetical protein
MLMLWEKQNCGNNSAKYSHHGVLHESWCPQLGSSAFFCQDDLPVKRNDTCKGAWNLVRRPGRQGISATRIRVCIKVTIQHVQHNFFTRLRYIARQEHMWCVCKDFEMVKIHSKSSHWSVQKIQNLVHPFTVHIFIYSVAKFLVKTHSSLFHTLFKKKVCFIRKWLNPYAYKLYFCVKVYPNANYRCAKFQICFGTAKYSFRWICGAPKIMQA